jgi:hypothetical protein
MRRLEKSVLFGVLLAGAWGGQATSQAHEARPESTSAPPVHVFYSGPAAPERLVFAFRAGELFVQVPALAAGGVPTQKLYLRDNVPPDLANKIRFWLEREQTSVRREPWGEVKRNGPTALTRHTVLNGPHKVHFWDDFIADDQVKELLAAVKTATARPDFEVERPPRWVEDDARVRNDFFAMEKGR